MGIFLAFFFVFLGMSDPGRLSQRGEEGAMSVLRRGEASRICFRCNVC